MTSSLQNQHYQACMQFADGVALMTRGNFGDAYDRLSEAYETMIDLYQDAQNEDAVHIDLFATTTLLAAGQGDALKERADYEAAQGMLKAWEGCKESARGTMEYERQNQLSPQAMVHYQNAVPLFAEAVSLLEACLGKDHPELFGPLGDYGSVLLAVNREADANKQFDRMSALPPKKLSMHMIGGGYPIMQLDPFGTNKLLPSQTT